jgi:general secretion pathway protein A
LRPRRLRRGEQKRQQHHQHDENYLLYSGTVISTVTDRPPTAMYEEFYGFVQSPFTLAPDPRFLYRSESHDEAIRLLLQSIRRKEGFIVLTGDIGTGKTTICRALLEQLDTTTFTSLVLNPFVSVEELLREILLDFGVVSRDAVRNGRLTSATKHELISTLHEFLLSLMPIHGSGVLIIDEAQHLSPDVLEQIRIVSNLETNQSKLLQIVLVGQLNLLEVLHAADMRQLDQRISLRAVLKPLTRAEVEAYIGHRLSVARGSSSVTFDTAAIDAVHELSAGVPRVINLLCDRALTIGSQYGVATIADDVIEEAARGLSLRRRPSLLSLGWWTQHFRRWFAALAAVLAVIMLTALAPLHRLVTVVVPAAPSAPTVAGAEPFVPRDPPAIEIPVRRIVVKPPSPEINLDAGQP